jgi:hypothetical protein
MRGCDYRLADTSTAADARPAQGIQFSARAGNNSQLLPPEMMARFRSTMANAIICGETCHSHSAGL